MTRTQNVTSEKTSGEPEMRPWGIGRMLDLCLDQDGNYYWIELNPNGQWGWLEDEAGIPLTASFADLLEQGTP